MQLKRSYCYNCFNEITNDRYDLFVMGKKIMKCTYLMQLKSILVVIHVKFNLHRNFFYARVSNVQVFFFFRWNLIIFSKLNGLFRQTIHFFMPIKIANFSFNINQLSLRNFVAYNSGCTKWNSAVFLSKKKVSLNCFYFIVNAQLSI